MKPRKGRYLITAGPMVVVRSADGSKVVGSKSYLIHAPKTSKGRPLLTPGVPLKRASVMLDAKTLALAKKIGSGNVSAGIRRAVAYY